MPRADTMCSMEVKSNPVPTKYNPLGAKGAGEAGTVGAMPVVMNAVIDALAPLGVTDVIMPATRRTSGAPSRRPRSVTMGQIVGAAVVSHHPGLVQPKEVRVQRGNGRDSDLIEGCRSCARQN